MGGGDSALEWLHQNLPARPPRWEGWTPPRAPRAAAPRGQRLAAHRPCHDAGVGDTLNLNRVTG